MVLAPAVAIISSLGTTAANVETAEASSTK
jgi:hypothetical protein